MENPDITVGDEQVEAARFDMKLEDSDSDEK